MVEMILPRAELNLGTATSAAQCLTHLDTFKRSHHVSIEK